MFINFLIVLIAIIYLVDYAHTVGLHIQKCRPGDGVCLGNIYTQLLRNSKDHPELNMPDLSPYRPHKTWHLETHNPTLLQLVTFSGDGSNIRLHGLNNARVELVKGFGPNSRNNDIYARISVPCITFCTYFDAIVRMLSLIPFPASGDLTATLKCVKIHLNIKSENVIRNGEKYLQINDMKCSLNILCNFHVDFEFDTTIPVTRDIVNNAINSNWRRYEEQLGPDFRKFTCQIAHSILVPILAKVPIKNFFI